MKVLYGNNKRLRKGFVSVIAPLFICFSPAFSLDFCVKPLQNPYPEHYLSVVLMKKIERAILESGNSINCTTNSKELLLYVKDFKEIPVAYTAQQRVSIYNLTISVYLKTGELEKTYTNSTAYSQETGAYGNIVRRKAIDTVTNIIYLNMVEDLKNYTNK